MIGIHKNEDFRGHDLRGELFDGLFIECDFTGAKLDGMMTVTSTLFFECRGIPEWLKRPCIGRKKGEVWGEHGKVR